jgi:two-component system response regulator RegA
VLVEWKHIPEALKYNNGNFSATARQLSMYRRTLQKNQRLTQQLIKR